ncbi:MAG: hypothetical protein ACOX8R_01650 [Bacillota bacterium]|jgi:hypothetical protein
MKKYAKLLLVVACVAMVFAMSVGVSAANYSDNSAVYTNTAPAASTSVTVTLNFQSAKVGSSALDESTSVTLTSDTATTFKVVDVLAKFAADNSDYTLTSVYWDENWNGTVVPFTSASTNLFGITYNNVTYSPAGVSSLDGWKYRVNTKLPQQDQWTGSMINQAYVRNGDVIDFYYDNSTGSTEAAARAAAARFTRIYDVSYANNTASVTVQQSYDWFLNASPWTSGIVDFAAYQWAVVVVYNAAGQYVGYGITDSNGVASIPNLTDGATYTAVVDCSFGSDNYIDNTGCSFTFVAQ